MCNVSGLGIVRVAMKFVCAFALLVISFHAVGAQTATPRATPPPSTPINPSDKDESPLTSFEEEIRAKRAIKMAEKDHQENVDRAKEVADIAKALQVNLKDKTTIDHDAEKKLE